MPFSSNNGSGPWGSGDRGDRGRGERGKSPWGSGGGGSGGGKPPGPDLDDLIQKGREQLRVVLGGRGGGPAGPGRRGPGGGGGGFERMLPIVIPVLLIGIWVFTSFYTVKPEEKSVELFLGEFSEMGEPGLNFAPWPLVTYEVLPVTREHVIDIGAARGPGASRSEQALMLTGDENIVDVDFQVVWNISDPAKYLFNLADPEMTVRAVAESAMREIIARSELKPILSRDRAIISQELEALIQDTLDSYEAGMHIVRVNFERADPPAEVIDAFRDVQAAEQDRVTQESRAQAYANQRLAAARGDVAEVLQEAEGYRAQVVNEALGDASRFESVYAEYVNAPSVTRKRLYLEALEDVFRDVDKILIDQNASTGSNGGQGVVPYLPLDQLRRGQQSRSTQTRTNEEAK